MHCSIPNNRNQGNIWNKMHILTCLQMNNIVK